MLYLTRRPRVLQDEGLLWATRSRTLVIRQLRSFSSLNTKSCIIIIINNINRPCDSWVSPFISKWSKRIKRKKWGNVRKCIEAKSFHRSYPGRVASNLLLCHCCWVAAAGHRGRPSWPSSTTGSADDGCQKNKRERGKIINKYKRVAVVVREGESKRTMWGPRYWATSLTLKVQCIRHRWSV